MRAALIAGLACTVGCKPPNLFLQTECSNDERVLMVTADPPRLVAATLSPCEAASQQVVAEGGVIISARLDRADFIDGKGAPVDRTLWDGLTATLDPAEAALRSPVACGYPSPARPLLTYPGDACPLPPFVPLVVQHVSGGRLEPSEDGEAFRSQLEQQLRLSWPGSACAPDSILASREGGFRLEPVAVATAYPDTLDGNWTVANGEGGAVVMFGGGVLASTEEAPGVVHHTGASNAVGISGGRFVLSSPKNDVREAYLELVTSDLAVLATATISVRTQQSGTIQHWIAGEDLLVEVSTDRNGTYDFHVCAIGAAPPSLVCAPLLLAQDLVPPAIGYAVTRTPSGLLMGLAPTGDALFIERVPRPEELNGDAMTLGATRGEIPTVHGTIAWRVDRLRLEDPSGVPVVGSRFGDRSGSSLGNRLLLGAADADGSRLYLADDPGPAFVRTASPAPVFRAAPYGPFPVEMRVRDAWPGESVLRIELGGGSWFETDQSGARLACHGLGCDPPTPGPLDASFFVDTSVPGFGMAVKYDGSEVMLRGNGSSEEFRSVYRQYQGDFGALAARGREFWVFRVPPGVDRSALASLDPPIHAPLIVSDQEIAFRAAYDPGSDDLVVLGDRLALGSPFIRRVSPNGDVRGVPIPPELELMSTWVDVATVIPGKVLIATLDGRLFLLQDLALHELPRTAWEAARMQALDGRKCPKIGLPHGAVPLIRHLSAAGGVGFVHGCLGLSLRVFAHSEAARIESVAHPDEGANHFSTSAALCPNAVLRGNEGFVELSAAPLEMSLAQAGEAATLFAARVLLVSDTDTTAAIVGDERSAAVVRTTPSGGTVTLLGSHTSTAFAGLPRAAIQNQDGTILIAVSPGRLLLARP